MTDVWTIEHQLWLGGVEAYAEHMANDCVMLFGPMGIMQRNAIIKALAQAPRWTDVSMSDQVMIETGDTTVLAYKAVGTRGDDPAYTALCSSTYVRQDGRWKIAQHQQTPLEK